MLKALKRHIVRARFATVVYHPLNRRLLILSVDAGLQSAALLALNSRRFRLERMASVEEVLETARKSELDVIILDADTPGIELREGLRRIREAAAEVPLIVVTGDNSVEMGKRIVQEGVFFYTVKPVSVWEVGAIVEAAWESREIRLEREPWREALQRLDEHRGSCGE